MKFETIEIDYLTKPAFETTIVKLKLQNDNNLFLIAAYATSSGKNEFTAELNKIFENLKIYKNNNYFLLAGDLNAKHSAWDNITNNNRRIALYNWLNTNQITYRLSLLYTEVPTYPKGGSFLDVCIADNRLHFHDLTTDNKLKSYKYDSGHRTIKISLNTNTLK